MSNREAKAPLDRRVEIIEDRGDRANRVFSMSDLRDIKRVVLIGEPGMGKSEALNQEAETTQGAKVNVRTLVNSPAETRYSGRAHLDALDEYRSDGSAADKANFLASSLTQKCPDGWILSCRSQDWRKDADLNAINEQYGQSDGVVVAKLLPLEKHEASSILSLAGEADPDHFYDEALKKGAHAFLGNPLSLLLLQKVVSVKGDWPETRYEVFEAATNQLCHENNEDRRFQHRKSASEILNAAEELCAQLLVTGARAFWSSNAVPPGAADATEYLKASDTGIERDLIDQALDTPLFSGEGEEFEPIHRSIAEFLAARFLAKKAIGTLSAPSVPLSRVLALICSTDQKAPTELRGVYAWFASHLEKLGKPDLAEILCDRDPLTVVAYGDAGAFSTKIREQLLFSLDRDDPFFRSHSEGDTALNTLAGDDLAPSFQAILNGKAGTGHALVTVYDILKTGKPVMSLRPLLRGIALDPKRAERERWRAFDAWMNGEDHPQKAMRKLFDDLASEPPSNGRENLRAFIAADLDEGNLTAADVRSILGDYERSEEDNTVGRLFRLIGRLEEQPLLDMFEEPTMSWRPDITKRRKSSGISHDLDRVFAGLVRSQDELKAATLWRWFCNSEHDRLGGNSRESKKAIVEWFEKDPANEASLFLEVLGSVAHDDGPWMPSYKFIGATGRVPSEECLTSLISPWAKQRKKQGIIAKSLAAVQGRFGRVFGQSPRESKVAEHLNDADRQLFAAIAHACKKLNEPSPIYWLTFEAIEATLGVGEVFADLTTCEIPEYKERQFENKQKRELQAEKDRKKRVEEWADGQSLLRSGDGNLDHAAMVYFGYADNAGRRWSAENLENYFTPDIAASIIAGFKRRAEIGLGVPISKLGRVRAKQSRNCMETAVVAAVSILLKEQDDQALNELTLETAVIVLLNRFFCEDEEHRSQLKGWALRKLDSDSEHASDLLVSFWLDELDARIALKQDNDVIDIDLVHDLSCGDTKSNTASMALSKLFAKRHDFPPRVLRSLVRAACHQWDVEEILRTCDAIVADGAVSKENRQVWTVVAFAISPQDWGKQFHKLFAKGRQSLADLSNETEDVRKNFPLSGTTDQIAYHTAMVEILGPFFDPSGDPFGPKDIVQGSISSLAEITEQKAQKELLRLRNLSTLRKWESNLRHALSSNLRAIRDDMFNHATLNQFQEALTGGPPINAADLRAVMVEVLRDYQREIEHGDLPAWNGYWNTDKYGKAVTPKIENVCRDQVLTIVRPKLENFAVDLALSEAQRAGGRRADVLLATRVGRNLPIEAKRHYNSELWTAISEQLQDYADDPLADGFGIYLVFWFGVGAGATPNAPAGTAKPSSATELEQALIENMMPDQRNRFEVIVLDLEPPKNSLAKGPADNRTADNKSADKLAKPGN